MCAASQLHGSGTTDVDDQGCKIPLARLHWRVKF